MQSGLSGGIKLNDFNADLEYSFEQRDNELFDSFYYRIFPNIKEIEFVTDINTQRKGIDKIIHFVNGNSFRIDEKKRRTDYGDILLELWSVYEKKKRGWLYTTQCDYIVYAIMPTNKIYLLPTVLLKRAWLTNQKEWFVTYKIISARNKRYTTKNIGIPINVLLVAIQTEMVHDTMGSNE